MSRLAWLLSWATAGLIVLPGLAPASAAADTTPPSLSLPPFAAFTVGDVLPFTSLYGGGDDVVSMVLRWTAGDTGGSGLCGVGVWEVDGTGSEWDPSVAPDSGIYYGLANSLSVGQMFWTSGSESGQVFDADVVAYDCAGNYTHRRSHTLPTLADQSGRSVFEDSSDYPVTATKTGTWGTSRFTGWLGGSTWKTSQKGASITYRFPEPVARGSHLALIMPTGPDRGAASIYVGGVLKGTVDTHATRKAFRKIVFDAWLPAGTTTVRIVNLATPGHPRIDLDGVLLNP